MNWIKHPLEPRHLGVPSGASKMISESMVCLAQTMHASCTDTNTVSKWTKTRFHMTHVTLEFHQVCPKQFLRLSYVWHKLCTFLASRLTLSLNGLNQASIWASSPRSTFGLRYIWHKPCTYLAPTLTMSLNEPKQGSTWPTSPSRSIQCVENDFWAYGMFGANPAPVLHRHQHCLQMDQNKIPYDPRHLGVPSSTSKMISKVVVCLAQTVHQSCIKICTISERTKLSFHLSLVT
jgi:hypothetical protein